MGTPALPPFARFLEEHRVGVYRFLLAAVGRDAADDCFQETFISALRAYPALRDERNLKGWIFTIATRKALDHWRDERRRPIPTEDLPEVAAPEPDDGDPELWRSVRDLPPMQRAAVLHRYVLDLPYAAIAEALGCSVEAARANAYEGRRRLRNHLTGGARGAQAANERTRASVAPRTDGERGGLMQRANASERSPRTDKEAR